MVVFVAVPQAGQFSDAAERARQRAAQAAALKRLWAAQQKKIELRPGAIRASTERHHSLVKVAA